MVFSFGPSMLAERGWSVQAASSVTSVTLWLVALSVPVGGLLADRTGRHRLVLVGGMLAFAAMLLVTARVDTVVPAFVALGLVSGLSAGPIMSLPSRVLLPETRAIGMGIFFTLFYLIAVLGPVIGGYAATLAGTARVTFDLGCLMLIACCPALWLFEMLANDGAIARSVARRPSSAVS
jgi:MFS family permease